MAHVQLRCIYKIVNKENKKFYIGSTTEYHRRSKEHLYYLRNNMHYNIYLQEDYNKYGEDAFEFQIIEIVGNKEELLGKEQYYLDTLKPNYNILIIADRPTGVKRRPETIEKVRQANLGLVHPEWRNKIKSEAQGGDNHWTKKRINPFSDKSKKKMSDTKKQMYKDGYINPRKGVKLEPEMIKSIAEKLSKRVIQLTLNGEFIKEWDSVNQIDRETEFDKSCISLCCRGKRKTHGGYKWEYKNV